MIKKTWLLLSTLLILYFVTSCSAQPVSTEIQTTIDNLNERVSELELKQSTINVLQERVSDLEIKIIMLENSSSDVAYLDPTSDGYSKSGEFLVLISKVEEYLDGVKVYLTIGNPNNATYNGFTIKARYGTKYDLNSPYTEWEKSIKEKEIQLSSELKKGSWNNAEIILPTINPKDFSYLTVQIFTSSISLLQ